MEIKVLNGQSLFDLAVQAAGTVEAAFDIALANVRAVVDELTPGAALVIPMVLNKQIAEYYRVNGIRPATALSAQDAEFAMDGIGAWRVEYDFEVS
jgi:hypothetical protein